MAGALAAHEVAISNAGDFTITATVPACGESGTSSSFLVVAAAASRYIVSTSSSSPVAGSPNTVTAQLADAYGNAVSAPGRVVTWGSTNGGSFASPTSVTEAGGLATVVFTASPRAGTVHTVSAADGGCLTGTSAAFTTVPGPAVELQLLVPGGVDGREGKRVLPALRSQARPLL